LFLFSPSRFLASTPDTSSSNNVNKPLPQGLCGGPVLDINNHVCGVVEGIVPMDHPDDNLAGSAAFIPLHHLHSFVEWAECFILQQIVPEKLFNKIKDIKENKDVTFGNDFEKQDKDVPIHDIDDIAKKTNAQYVDSKYTSESAHITAEDAKRIERDLNGIKQQMEEQLSKEQLDLIYSTIEEEKRAVVDLLQTEGGDMDDAVAKIRARTLKKQMKIIQKFAKEQGETIVVEDIEQKKNK